jgi:aspartyl-tRNA(Asn)/glutamyl-tRNA(Gln) amidotransferase subunit C
MPNGLTRADVEIVAALASLELDDTELDLFTRQLGDILHYAEQVQRIDTTGIPPTASIVSGQAADRADVVRPSLDRAEALANAPDGNIGAGLFRVPRVIG